MRRASCYNGNKHAAPTGLKCSVEMNFYKYTAPTGLKIGNEISFNERFLIALHRQLWHNVLLGFSFLRLVFYRGAAETPEQVIPIIFGPSIRSKSAVMKLKVIIHDAEEGGYWAEVPAIEGCATQGDTFEELLENIYEAIEGCLSVESQVGEGYSTLK